VHYFIESIYFNKIFIYGLISGVAKDSKIVLYKSAFIKIPYLQWNLSLLT